MNRVLIEPYFGKRVRIVLEPHFVLTGIIDYVDSDCIIFRTIQKSAVIHFSKIKEVYEV